MNSIMNIPGLKDCQVIKMEERKGEIFLYVEMERKPHPCPDCGQLTNKVHDYRWQKVQHLKWFERMTYIWYKRRRYACACGKRFSELEAFYQVVEESGIPEMKQAIETFRNWQVEILNSFVYGHSNGFLEEINNTTKVIKRNGYGYKNFKRFRARILLRHQYKGICLHIG
jgi:transposase